MEQKILFAGPVGSGKTTAIASISDIPVVTTERRASDDLQLRKLNTTVALDYGLIHLGEQQRVHLYGAPGQDRFDFMWEILSVGGIGLVLMLDHARPQMQEDLQHFLHAFSSYIRKVRGAMVIGVTRMDLQPGASLRPIREFLRESGLRVPVFEVDARRRDDVRNLLLALVSELDPAVQRAGTGGCDSPLLH